MNKDIAIRNINPLQPANFTEAIQFAEYLAKSNLVPANYKNNPADIIVAMQWGSEVGLGTLQALQSISVINGRPAIFGDASLALVMAHPAYEWHREGCDESGGWCEIKRRNNEPHQVRFTKEQAKRAGLLGKKGPWQEYPERMLQLRARGFALRDKFPDALRGVITAEEAQDMPIDAIDSVIVERPDPDILSDAQHRGLRASFNKFAADYDIPLQKVEDRARIALAKEFNLDLAEIHFNKITVEQRDWLMRHLLPDWRVRIEKKRSEAAEEAAK